jgi:CheY-like chemotaxis protein
MRQASILLIEDEALIRMMLVEMIEELGHKVVAEAGTVDAGRSLAEIEEYDCAILDISLQGANVRPVAEVIKGRGLSLFFLSGYGPAGLPAGFEGMPILAKPCTAEALKCTLDSILPNDDGSQESRT